MAKKIDITIGDQAEKDLDTIKQITYTTSEFDAIQKALNLYAFFLKEQQDTDKSIQIFNKKTHRVACYFIK